MLDKHAAGLMEEARLAARNGMGTFLPFLEIEKYPYLLCV